jgi:nucleotide-binding universal stress UspA family protein
LQFTCMEMPTEEGCEMANGFPTRVLLATDGSEEAELALQTATSLAKSTGSEMRMVPVDEGIPYLTEVLKREAEEQTEQQAQ